MKRFRRVWDSPTITTWGSFASRGLNLVVVLPLILSRFTTEEIALWYVLISILSLSQMLDLGFSPTFIRVFSFVKSTFCCVSIFEKFEFERNFFVGVSKYTCKYVFVCCSFDKFIFELVHGVCGCNLVCLGKFRLGTYEVIVCDEDLWCFLVCLIIEFQVI